MSLLGPFSFSALMSPVYLLLLVGVALLLVAEIAVRAPGTLNISTGETLARVGARRGEFARRLPALLRAAGLALLIVALARPVTGFKTRKERVNIVDIMLCVDVSGSMRSMDFIAGGKRRDRLFVTKEAVRDFLRSRKQKSNSRFGIDRVGLVLYAKYAWTQCPLTLDYGVLERELELVDINPQEEKSGRTAIGSAIGLALSRLRKSEAESKVIILLTDGLNNSGELDPITAARLAKDYDIRIYTIGAGSLEGGVVPQRGIFGRIWAPASEGIDEDTLKKIASATGAKYYRATDTESLVEAYNEINQLETTEVELGDYYEHEEGFVPYVFAGTLALLLSVFSKRLWFEVIP